MNYSKAIRVARALADVRQRELARRVAIDASLVSMLESGKRNPSLATLEKIAAALGIPFHLFTLLASEPGDLKGANSETVHQLATGLTKLLQRTRQTLHTCISVLRTWSTSEQRQNDGSTSPSQ